MTVKKIWKCEDVEIVFRQVRRTLPRTKFLVLAEEEVAAGDRDTDITGNTGNIFPEGIQLGSIKILRAIFRIPEGMRPSARR